MGRIKNWKKIKNLDDINIRDDRFKHKMLWTSLIWLWISSETNEVLVWSLQVAWEIASIPSFAISSATLTDGNEGFPFRYAVALIASKESFTKLTLW